MTKALLGRELLDVLREHGLLPEKTRRVVIDAPYNGAVEMYYTCLADERLLNVGLSAYLEKAIGVEIRKRALDGPIDITPTGAPMRRFSDEHGNHPGD